jgi:putative transposase
MPQSFSRIWIHALWATKDRQLLIEPAVENEIYDLMRQELIDMGCPVRIINGMPDHAHSLFLLNPQKSIADVIKQVKGGSSHSINEKNLILQKFSWQGGYAAYSVSESQLERVFQYIANQKKHHKKKTFLQEFEEFVALHAAL